MPDLSFQVESAQVDPAAAAPLLVFKVRIENRAVGEQIQNVLLRCQVRIEATRRRYTPAEQVRLVDLFGEPDRWSTTLGSLLWTHTSSIVPPFERQTLADLPVPCTFDFNVGTTKYFAGLEVGDVPLELQFSGTVFYRDDEDRLLTTQIPWDREAHFRLPIDAWRAMMDRYYPNSTWLRLRRDVFEQLRQYKSAHGITHWETVFQRLLAGAQTKACPEESSP